MQKVKTLHWAEPTQGPQLLLILLTLQTIPNLQSPPLDAL